MSNRAGYPTDLGQQVGDRVDGFRVEFELP